MRLHLRHHVRMHKRSKRRAQKTQICRRVVQHTRERAGAPIEKRRRRIRTEPRARIRVNEGHIGWVDIIFVMERKHADYLQEKFPNVLEGKQLHNLRIPDDFEFMDPMLVEMLRSGVSNIINSNG